MIPSECNAIIMNPSTVKAISRITTSHIKSSLIHKADIDNIAGAQIIKFTTLLLTK